MEAQQQTKSASYVASRTYIPAKESSIRLKRALNCWSLGRGFSGFLGDLGWHWFLRSEKLFGNALLMPRSRREKQRHPRTGKGASYRRGMVLRSCGAIQ